MDEIFDPNQRQELGQEITSGFSFKDFVAKNKIIIAAVVASILALSIALIILFHRSPASAPTSNNVFLSIKGASQISSGNETEYEIIYRNGENSGLVGATLEMFYASGFKFKSAAPAPNSSSGNRFNLPILAAGSTGEVKVRGKVSGATAEDKIIAAKLTYRLADFNSEFEVRAEFHTIILAPNLTLEITGPVDVTNGQETTFNVSYGNVARGDFENLVLEVQYPEGFVFTSSVPVPSKQNNVFAISKLGMGASGQVQITGTFSGESNQEKLVVAQLGQMIDNTFAPQLTTSASFKIVPSAMYLKIQSQPKDVVGLGQSVEFNLGYGNQSDVGMTNVVITLTLDTTIIDFSRLTVYNAIITGNTMTWKPATLQNLAVLAPSQKGEITFSAPIKSALTTNVQNLLIKASGSIKSDQIPKLSRSQDLELKLATQVGLQVSGDYIKGALPMRVGSSTTFAMTFLLTNLSNDLSDAELVASMLLPPSGWNSVVIPDSEKANLSYDPNSGIIKWKIGPLPAYSGKFTPARQVTFQLVVTPTESDRGKIVKLLSNMTVTGKDNFTGLDIKSDTVKEVTTATLDDAQIDQKGSSVQ